MGFFDGLFKGKKMQQTTKEYFSTVNGYTPVFTSREGGVYEMTLTQSAIHSFATNCSKLNPVVKGGARNRYGNMLDFKPNPIMTSYQFIYRVATIYETEHNVFIVPLYRDAERTIVDGVYPIRPATAEIIDNGAELFYRFTFANGGMFVIEADRVGHLKDRYYRNEFFGEGNNALNPTLDLIHAQNQGIENGIKSSAWIRFLVRLRTTLKPEDVETEKKRFRDNNLDISNDSGALFYDQKYEDIKPIESKPWTVDAEQSASIENNVYNYFGTSENILQNKYSEAEWDAYYEGKIEPFAIQLSQVMTAMLFSQREVALDNQVHYEANRLQFLTMSSKVTLITSLFDRGLMSDKIANQILNMPQDDGLKYIRGEYVLAANISKPLNGGYDAREDSALNGAQVTSMVQIVASVASGAIPPQSGMEILKVAYSLDDEAATKIMGGAGVSWNLAPQEGDESNAEGSNKGIQDDGPTIDEPIAETD